MYYIYRITNKINGKTYIGQHKYKKLNDKYMGSGVLLRKAQVKYGIENFKKDILVFNISRKEHVDLLEKTFIAAEREKVGIKNCYNIANGGEGGAGCHRSEETKKKIKDATNKDAEYLDILRKIKLEENYITKTKTRAKQQYIDARLQEVFGELSKTTLTKIRGLDSSN